MAYGIRWQVNFDSVAGTGYRVNILDEGWTGSITPLTGSENPFVIDEDNDDDIFIPVRTKTGYINIVTDSINLVRTIIPTNGATRKVMAYEWDDNGGIWTVIFEGFVQPRLIDIDIWQGKTEIGIPIECCISGLRYRQFKRTGFIYMNEFIADAFNNFDNFIFQCPALTSADQAKEDSFWLKNKFTSALFTDETYYDILEYICIFFGWTCRTDGGIVYFVANRNIDDTYNQNLFSISLAKLQAISGSALNPTSEAWIDSFLPNNAIASMNTKMLMTEGASQGIVRCDLDVYDESISPNEDSIKQSIQNNIFPQNHYYHEEEVTPGTYIVDQYYVYFGPTTIDNVNLDGYNVYRFLMNSSQNPGNTDISKKYTTINVLETYETKEVERIDPETGDTYREVIETLDTHKGWLNMTTVETYIFTTGKFIISFTEPLYGTYYGVTFAIEVGNLWYNPTNRQWESTYTSDMRITVGYDQEYEIPALIATGTVTVRIVEKSSFGNWTLQYSAESTETVDSSIKKIVHMKSTGMDFSLKKEIVSKFSLKENLISMSKNFIFKPDLTPRTSLWTDLDMDERFNPLDRLASEIVEEMRHVGEVLELDLRDSMVSDITPITKFYIEWFDTTYYPLSISQDLNNDTATIKFVKRINSSSSS